MTGSRRLSASGSRAQRAVPHLADAHVDFGAEVEPGEAVARGVDHDEAVAAFERLRERVADDAGGEARAHQPEARREIADRAHAFERGHEGVPRAGDDFGVHEDVGGFGARRWLARRRGAGRAAP